MTQPPAFILPADLADGVHRFRLRIYFEDTDAGGLVYHANYLRYAERGRSEALRALGVPHAEMILAHARMFVVRRAQIDYERPARLDDDLIVATRTQQVGAASVMLAQDILRAATRLVGIKLHLACVTATDPRPARLPAPMRTALAAMRDAGVGSGLEGI